MMRRKIYIGWGKEYTYIYVAHAETTVYQWENQDMEYVQVFVKYKCKWEDSEGTVL